jgi:hypothetical protein
MKNTLSYPVAAAVAVLLSAVILAGCTTRLVDFTVISTKNIEWNRANEYRRLSDRVEGEDLVHWIIIIPTGVPSLEEAVDEAIESVPGAVALLDGVLLSKFWWIPYVYGQQSYIVEGTPLVDPQLAGDWNRGRHLVTYIETDGSLRDTRSVSGEEYLALRRRYLGSD